MQNHRTGKVESHHWRSSSPTSLLKQTSLEHVTQDCVQMAFDCLQRKKLYNLSEKPVSVLSHPHSKEVLHHIQVECVPVTARCISSQDWHWDWLKMTEGELFLNAVSDGAWTFLVGGAICLVNSNRRTKDRKVDEDQGKATGVNLRRENQGLELQNSRERKTNISHPIHRFITICKAKESWALEVGKINGNFFQ